MKNKNILELDASRSRQVLISRTWIHGYSAYNCQNMHTLNRKEQIYVNFVQLKSGPTKQQGNL